MENQETFGLDYGCRPESLKGGGKHSAAAVTKNDERKLVMQTRLGLKALGLSVLVMGVMAIGTAGVSQAETGACWGYLDGVKLECFTTSLESKIIIVPENQESTAATLLVATVNIEVTCKTVAFVEGGTLSANGSILLGRLEFGGCFSRTKTALGALGACTPEDPVAGVGKIRTEKGTGLIVLNGTEPVVKFSPDSGTNLAKIFMPECAVSTELIVTGNLVIADCEGTLGAISHKLTHLVSETKTAALQLMRVGGVLATIDGSFLASLASPHHNLRWANLPG